MKNYELQMIKDILLERKTAITEDNDYALGQVHELNIYLSLLEDMLEED